MDARGAREGPFEGSPETIDQLLGEVADDLPRAA